MSEEMAMRPGHREPFRIAGWMVATALLVPLLIMLTIPVVFALIAAPFISLDSRGIPVEPAWAGHVAMYGNAALISGVAGALLGRVPGIRPGHALVAGLLTALSGAILYYGKEALRGFPTRGVGDVLLGFLIILLNIAPVMTFFLTRSARKRLAR
jgi:hypothetical protein